MGEAHYLGWDLLRRREDRRDGLRRHQQVAHLLLEA